MNKTATDAIEDLMTKIQAFGLACYTREPGEVQIAMQDEIRAHLEREEAKLDQWKATLWAVARELNCLPSTFSDGNGHVLKAAIRHSADRERLDWLLWKLPGDAIRYCVGELADTSDGNEFRAAIDAARLSNPSAARTAT